TVKQPSPSTYPDMYEEMSTQSCRRVGCIDTLMSYITVFSIATLGIKPQSIRGQFLSEKRLPSVPPSHGRTPPFGLHRYKPVRARLSLARQGISLESFCDSSAITSPGGPARRRAVRTISSSRGRDVRRMASED